MREITISVHLLWSPPCPKWRLRSLVHFLVRSPRACIPRAFLVPGNEKKKYSNDVTVTVNLQMKRNLVTILPKVKNSEKHYEKCETN